MTKKKTSPRISTKAKVFDPYIGCGYTVALEEKGGGVNKARVR